MAQDEQLRTERLAGAEAQQLLDSPAFKHAFDGVEASIIGKLRTVGINDDATRNQLVLTLQLLTALRAAIKQTVETGQIATVQIEQPSRMARLFGR